MEVSSRLRLLVTVVGLLLLVFSLLALAYAVWPGEVQRLQATLAPTLFAAP